MLVCSDWIGGVDGEAKVSTNILRCGGTCPVHCLLARICSNMDHLRLGHLDHLRRTVCWGTLNSLRPRQHGCHFADDSFKCIFLNESVWILLTISLFVPKVRINNIPAFVQIMAWRHPGDKPLSESVMISLSMHIFVGLNEFTHWPLRDVEVIFQTHYANWYLGHSHCKDTLRYAYISHIHTPIYILLKTNFGVGWTSSLGKVFQIMKFHYRSSHRIFSKH